MDKIDDVLTRGVEKIYPSKQALAAKLRSGKKLKLYQGFDPTGPKLHIGHLVGLMKLKQFQELGHKVIFLIGDVTATIGDPSGKTTVRKVLTRKEVEINAKSYKEQASRILDFEGENPVEIQYNSRWYDEMNALEFAKITHYLTFAQISERDLFRERQKAGQDIYMNEFVYPVLQAYDSVAMDVDLEVGGSDQMFNMMMGRKLMRNILNKEKFVITTSLLADSQGRKIGKTEGNVIALDSEPDDFYGMIMSLPDDAIIKCFELITDMPMKEVEEIRVKISRGENPMTFKKRLAYELTKILNNVDEAQKAAKNFDRVFRDKKVPDKLKEVTVLASNIVGVLVSAGLATSKSDARRLVEQNGVRVDGKVVDLKKEFEVGKEYIVQVGRLKFAKVKIN